MNTVRGRKGSPLKIILIVIAVIVAFGLIVFAIDKTINGEEGDGGDSGKWGKEGKKELKIGKQKYEYSQKYAAYDCYDCHSQNSFKLQYLSSLKTKYLHWRRR